MRQKANYGIDSPGIIAGLSVASIIFFVTAFLLLRSGAHTFTGALALIVGAYFFAGACGMLWYSKVEKFRVREKLLDSISWKGNETVLDVGCGRGLLTVGAARRLTTGKSIGVDLWVRGALTDNRSGSVIENATSEGVSDRVETREGDVRQLPFDGSSFDVVISNYVVHEVKNASEREQMMCEIVRVLKPGGRLALVDFIFTDECVNVLLKLGIADAKRVRLSSALSFWIAAIMNFGFVQVYMVVGSKTGFLTS